MSEVWWKVASDASSLIEGERLHTCIEGRYISIFRHHGILGAIDSTCYHAGGPLAQGEVKDIEELGFAVVTCPWHRFMVSIQDGCRAYQAIDIVNGKPITRGWVKGKPVQRAHRVMEENGSLFVALNKDEIELASDGDSHNFNCVKSYKMHPETPVLYSS